MNHHVLFVTSMEDGLTSIDHKICSILRKMNKNNLLVINKCDKQNQSKKI